MSSIAHSFDFLPEHWSIIKEYAGIYNIRKDWDLSKLDNNLIDLILCMVSPSNGNINLVSRQTIDKRIKFIWKNLHKKKLYDVDCLIKDHCKYCIRKNTIKVYRKCMCISV